jgi:hypothetical protein
MFIQIIIEFIAGVNLTPSARNGPIDFVIRKSNFSVHRYDFGVHCSDFGIHGKNLVIRNRSAVNDEIFRANDETQLVNAGTVGTDWTVPLSPRFALTGLP